jgi:signal transduction histidine kinase
MDSMRLQIERAGAAVSLNVHGSDHRLMADRHHMMSVVFNLLDNALKYSKSVPKIDITVTESPGTLELRFADNGIGVPAAFQDKVFDKFFRVPTGDVHDVKGYGLGLSYVAHIVKLHQGTIRLQSTDGAGSVFIIQLPKQHG